ncbi:MAG: hypothetical protein P4L33_08055 [Capsulimonadaceae bacterium]|nr:hypothetical protein [Capsulimonadaceae bacterium]
MDNNVWQKLQSIDPRALYVVVLVMISASIVLPGLTLPIIPGQQSKDAFNAVVKAANTPGSKFMLVSGWWSASTRGENDPQTRAILTHLMRLHVPFGVLSFDPQNPQLMDNIETSLAQKYGYVYGRDYINFGYQVAPAQTLKGIVTNMKGTLKTDWHSKPLETFPVMANVNSIKDVAAVIDITPVSSLDAWLGLVVQKYHTPFIYVPTAVMAPEGYPYRDSGQVAGIVIGVKGAGDYETLLGVKMQGTQVSTALSMVYALIILLVIVGNIGYHGARRAAALQAAGEGRGQS